MKLKPDQSWILEINQKPNIESNKHRGIKCTACVYSGIFESEVEEEFIETAPCETRGAFSLHFLKIMIHS